MKQRKYSYVPKGTDILTESINVDEFLKRLHVASASDDKIEEFFTDKLRVRRDLP